MATPGSCPKCGAGPTNIYFDEDCGVRKCRICHTHLGMKRLVQDPHQIPLRGRPRNDTVFFAS